MEINSLESCTKATAAKATLTIKNSYMSFTLASTCHDAASICHSDRQSIRHETDLLA